MPTRPSWPIDLVMMENDDSEGRSTSTSAPLRCSLCPFRCSKLQVRSVASSNFLTLSFHFIIANLEHRRRDQRWQTISQVNLVQAAVQVHHLRHRPLEYPSPRMDLLMLLPLQARPLQQLESILALRLPAHLDAAFQAVVVAAALDLQPPLPLQQGQLLQEAASLDLL